MDIKNYFYYGVIIMSIAHFMNIREKNDKQRERQKKETKEKRNNKTRERETEKKKAV